MMSQYAYRVLLEAYVDLWEDSRLNLHLLSGTWERQDRVIRSLLDEGSDGKEYLAFYFNRL